MDLPKRKHPRLDQRYYSVTGAYFVTICTKDRRCFFANITQDDSSASQQPQLQYTKYGYLAEERLLSLKSRFSFLKIDKYVVMPNHIHIIFVFDRTVGQSNEHKTLMDVVCAYKSLTSNDCQKNGFVGKIFQTSFHEHIIRDYDEYENIVEYIHNNPLNWYYDELYSNR